MRAQLLALAVTVMSGVAACSIDVREPGEINADSDMVIYPRARRVANAQTDSTSVSFAGSFAETRVFPETFESDDAPAEVLGFYRTVMRAHSDVIQCRGNINIRRSRRAEYPVCIEHPSSQVVQLAAGNRSPYRLVAVKPRGTATEFTLFSIYVR
jgi:hypothetical protein